jgi:hypothetical protein
VQISEIAKQVKIKRGKYRGFPQNDQAESFQKSIEGAIIIVAVIASMVFVLGLVAMSIFTVKQMFIIRPLLAASAVFIIFTYVLYFRIHANVFGEIGFIYLALAMAYTILPAITFLMLDLDLPSGFDSLNFSVLSPQPEELGTHFWRHVLFISGVAVGYLAVRGGAMPQTLPNEKTKYGNAQIIAIMIALIGCSILLVTLLSSPVTTYLEHYTRFDHLSWTLRRLVYLCLIFKSGGYFVLLALMFSQYRRYRMLIFIVVPLLCAYEIIYSFGSRIETLTILLAFVGFYHFRVNPISLKKGILYLFALAVLFSGVEIIRSSNNDLAAAHDTLVTQGIKSASEFGAIYYTSFHLYAERSKGTIPPRDWQMFFYEFISLIPFLDHNEYNPQYWYAKHYFPKAEVPPQTMGVIADSAIWGGEFDLLVRSIINGAIFALLMRWFLRRREKWWALTIYIYCYATCIMTLKYSVLYHLTPLVRIILPTLLLTGVLFRLQKALTRLTSVHTGSVY